MTLPIITNEDIDELEREFNRQLIFDQDRREALINYGDVQACPGSGKTTLVATKLILLAKKWDLKYKGVCVLSHTNVAKDEIINRLRSHKQGVKFLQYPHFIGTIQDFIHKYLALPYCRSRQIKVEQIDDELCVSRIETLLQRKTKLYLAKKPNANLNSLKHSYQNGHFITHIPGFNQQSNSDSYQDLERVKNILVQEGLHFYQEMFEYSKALINENPLICHILRKRFPIVFIDEMQDTQEYQDEIINQIFRHNTVKMQRFGDPDQAIFDNMNGSPNTSYNSLNNLHVIQNSHRFNTQIAQKIKGLSLRRLNDLAANTSCLSGESHHTIFVYNQSSKQNILTEFANLCITCLPEANRNVIKAVGATSESISEYFPSFDRSKTPKLFRPTRLIGILHAYPANIGHNAITYNHFLNGVVQLLRLANKKYKDVNYYTVQLLKRELSDKEKLITFNRLVLSCFNATRLDSSFWNRQMILLLELLEIDIIEPKIRDFLAFQPPANITLPPSTNSPLNFFTHQNLKIEVSTIHGVKGETHDATLVMECKYHADDIDTVFDYLVNDNLIAPTVKRSQDFMKKLYVAMSRPKHLLCLAIDINHMSQVRIEQATQKGWVVRSVE